jgi:AcrR family transcriptional regulator
MPTRAEQKAETRARLLDAAALLVASKGVEGATVDAIAAGAGVTTGALYASFRTKHELLAALVAERHHDTSHVPLVELMADVGERWSAVLDADPVGADLLTALLHAAGRDEGLRDLMSEQLRANARMFAARIEEEDLRLRLPADDAALLVQVIAAGAAVLGRVLGEVPPDLLTRAVGLLRDER